MPEPLLNSVAIDFLELFKEFGLIKALTKKGSNEPKPADTDTKLWFCANLESSSNVYAVKFLNKNKANRLKTTIIFYFFIL